MLQAPGNRSDLDEALPLRPPLIGSPRATTALVERALDLRAWWRVPLTVVMGTVIATAACFAYRFQDGPPAGVAGPPAAHQAGPGTDGSPGGAGAVAGAVRGMVDDREGGDASEQVSPEPGARAGSKETEHQPMAYVPEPIPRAGAAGPGAVPGPAGGATITTTTSTTTTTTAPERSTTATPPEVRPPPSCEVQIGGRGAGVEIQDRSRHWAPSYAFFDRSGDVILSTSSLGPPDDVGGRRDADIEWTSRRYGFDESEVHSVAAEDGQGNRSERITCRRARDRPR